MYTIGQVIYGVPVTDKIIKSMQHIINGSLDDILDNDDLFDVTYEGCCNYWFGIYLNSIDECKNVDIDKLSRVDEDICAAYTEKLTKLPKEIQNLFLEPKWMIIWTHS